MARRESTKTKRPIEPYQHTGQERLNNPPVGLVTPDTDPDAGPRTYAYDSHLDPQLHWAGKAEIDPDLTKAYRGTVSLPFEPGEHRRIAVKIVDDQGIESLKVLEVAI